MDDAEPPRWLVSRRQRSRAKTLRGNLTDAEQHLWSGLRGRRLDGLSFRRAEKLFINAVKELNVNRIITWSDNRYTNGKLYERLGFTKGKSLDVDYILYNGNSHKVKKKQGSYKLSVNRPPNMLVEEYEQQNKWYRVYDAGKIEWVYKK